MISATQAYKTAIVNDTRRILLRAVIDIIDPDIVYGSIYSTSESAFSKPEQLHDKNFAITSYATLEHNRWVLNRQLKVLPDNGAPDAEKIGFWGNDLSDEDGEFSPAQYVEMQFSNVSILQACSVYFPTANLDGVPVDFKIEFKQGGTVYYTKTFTENTADNVSLSGFTVNNPDAIRVTVTKWSLPGRRFRVVEIIPGVYEEWDGNIIAEFTIKHQGDVSCLSLPYGTCTIKMDNIDRRFEPRSKSGLFQSLEDRQGIDVSMAVRLPDGTDEYKRVGVFYQYSGGWKTGDNGLTMQWDLVDIVGLLSEREFILPDTLPTTLGGWISALVAQLGINFEDRYTVDNGYSAIAVTVQQPDDVVGITCGDILRYVCMATGTWPRADAETGFLAVEPLWKEGNKITLDNLKSYPVMKANEDIAAIIFTLNDGNNEQYIVSGTSTASSETKSVSNPFIKTKEQALKAAKLILSTYGGNRIEIVGRGDPASEIGDVDTVWLNESIATTARRIQQNLSFSGGVLTNCASVLLQADGVLQFEGREVITTSSTWTAPKGATHLRIILVGKGMDGASGTNGTWDEAGKDGANGAGGKVWSETISINEQQQFEVVIGNDTNFGQYSSANGRTYQYGYTDVASGDSFARSGVFSPVSGSGDGGAGGKGGVKGNQHTEIIRGEDDDGNPITSSITIIDNYPGTGQSGKLGVSGCVVVYWDKTTN